jgi:Peptidase C13 family
MVRLVVIIFFVVLWLASAAAQVDVRARVAAMPAGTSGLVDIFVISLAGDGKQSVFNREAQLAIAQLDARYATAPRSLLLANQPKPDLATPIASRLTMQTAITAMAERMNRDEDILLLFLTSHGWKDATVALSNGTDDLPALSALDVDTWLKAAGISRSIIIVSACYSGSWAEPLQNPNRILLMAARQDRSSFGCSDDRELTFFGEALLAQNMRRGLPLLPAFEAAKKLITTWEARDKLTASLPQRALGANLLPVWQKLEDSIGGPVQSPVRSVAAEKTMPATPHCKLKHC